MPKKKSGQTVHSLSTLPYYAVVYHKNTPSARVFSRKMAGFSGIFASNGGKAGGAPVRAACSACQKRAVPFFDKRVFAPTRAFSRIKCAKTHSLRAKYFSRRTRPTEVPLGGAAVKNGLNTIRGLRAANSARPFDSLGRTRRVRPFCVFLQFSLASSGGI